MKPIVLVTCTRYSESEFPRKASIAPYIEAHRKCGNIQDVMIVYHNHRGLPSIYNQIITEKYRGWIALCVHDDIEIYNIDLASRLNRACSVFDIVGLAGNAYHNPTNSPVRWDRLSPENAKTRSGQVAHPIDITVAKTKVKLPMTSVWGPSCVGVRVIDGVFIAFNVDACLARNHRFDEQFDFHFYDLDFSFGATQLGMKVGTCDIYILHRSDGNFSSDGWHQNEQKYKAKWGATRKI